MLTKPLAAGAALLALSALSSAALAVVNPTPGGIVVPVLLNGVVTCTDKNVEVCIDQAEGNAALIDTQLDALVAPETFQPTCQLTFTPIVKGGSISDVFGWYNVKPDPTDPTKFLRPTQAELFGMFAATGFQTGAQLAGQAVVLDLGVEAAAGRYTGGQIGFFLASIGGALSVDPTTHQLIGTPAFLFFTQHALNPGSLPNQTYYNVLTWQSVARANTFYFGWEDLPTNGGSDNDFDDIVFSVTGVQCGGGGQPCDTGLQGVCAAGVQQCKKGALSCVQSIQPSAEQCNALDDDCNGLVDDGDLCQQNYVCSRGRCVPKCGTGEFRCPSGSVCTPGGLCVDQACVAVECPAGQVCDAGNCVDSCSGIACPHGRVCRNGGCVDPCVGIECDKGFACVLGVCTSCECSACGAGLVCHDNQCIEAGCETQTCAAGSHCALGACVDDCVGVVCPKGQVCSSGDCTADPNAAAGGLPADGSDIVIINPSGGSSASGVAGAPGGGTRASNGPNHAGAPVTAEPGCGCKLPGGGTSSRGALLLLALLGIARRRRYGSRRCSRPCAAATRSSGGVRAPLGELGP